MSNTEDDRLSPLMRAAYRGDRAAFEALAADGSSDPWDRILTGETDGLPAPDSWSPDGFTPLHIAAFAGNAAAAQALLDAGADPDVFATASFAQVTPLGTCAFVGGVDVARVLLKAGADPSLTEVEGGTPLEVARANGHRELVVLLFVAHAHRHLEAARSALGEDATLANAAADWGSGDWETGLGAAAHVHNRPIAVLLLEYGARLDIFAAAMLGEVEIVEAILAAHPEMRDAKGPHGIPLRAHAQGAVVELLA